jgi:hypothetical protein
LPKQLNSYTKKAFAAAKASVIRLAGAHLPIHDDLKLFAAGDGAVDSLRPDVS